MAIMRYDKDRLRVLDQVLRSDSWVAVPPVSEGSILGMIDYLQGEGLDGDDDSRRQFNISGMEWLRPLYREYMNHMLRCGQIDIGSLPIFSLRVLQATATITDLLRIANTYVFVDEYQDTNKAQDKLLHYIFRPKTFNVFFAADEDEMVHQWGGADPERLRALREEYAVPVVRLPENYRCPQPIVAAANRLMQNGRDFHTGEAGQAADLELNGNDSMRLRQFDCWEEEMAWIASDINARDVELGNCAVLARSKRIVEDARKALEGNGTLASIVKWKEDFESPALRFICSSMKLADAPRDMTSLRRLCKAYQEFTMVDIRTEMVDAESMLFGGALLRGFVEATMRNGLERAEVAGLREILRSNLIERRDHMKFVKLSLAWFAKYGSNGSNGQEGLSEEAMEVEAWKRQVSDVEKQLGERHTLGQYLQKVSHWPSSQHPANDGVQCLTIHSAKGKKYESVYLAGLAEEVLPSLYAIRCGNNRRFMDEERRNCFAAMTSTHRILTITFSDSYFGEAKQPSRFLRDMSLRE